MKRRTATTRPAARAGIRARVHAELEPEIAAWLSDSDLLLTGRLPAQVASAAARSDSGPDGPRFMVLPFRRGESVAGIARVLVHWRLCDGDLPATLSTAGSPSGTVAASAVKRVLGTEQDLARESLAWMAPETRAAVLEFLVEGASGPEPAPRRRDDRGSLFGTEREVRLSASLHALREALRERLPVTLAPGGPMALVDAVARLDRDAFFIRGRIRPGSSRPLRVTVVSPEGSRVEILERAYWYDLAPSREAQDSAWKGFAAFVSCAPSARPEGWLVELETRAGALLEVGAPKVSTSASDVVRIVLEDLVAERLPASTLRTGQIVPAIRRLQRARQRAAAIETVKQFGPPIASPAVSVVVPLYRRIDLIEHQLTQFAGDPEMRSAELIYVLDSPELEDELLDSARRLFPLYGQPFRVAILSANVGFAGANNLGASIARGRLLLLMNSDVFPDKPGWLGAMARFYDGLASPGAIGPKLLYEDDTLQHAGMFFERLSDTLPWNNEHFFKGMHRDLPAAAVSRPVPAVTGACMMIATELYQRLGGLSGDYVQGDFEDSDLCLRLLEAGRQNWYFADVALYHLEASSYDPERRRLHDAFNRWFHTHLWGTRLEALGGPDVALIARAPKPAVRPRKLGDLVAAGTSSGS